MISSMTRASIWCFLLFAILITLVAGCGGRAQNGDGAGRDADQSVSASGGESDSEGSSPLTVGFSQIENENPWRIAQTISMVDEAERLGIELIYADAGGQTSKQLDDVRYLLDQGIDYLIFDPREYEESAPALDMARDSGVPVIVVDRDVRGVAGVDYLTRIATDFYNEGRLAAEWLVAQHGETPMRIVEVTGTEGSSAAMDRQRGFRSVMDRFAEHSVIVAVTADFVRAEAQRVMENVIQSGSRDFNAVFAHNDEMAIGVIQAMKNAGLVPGVDAIVVGIDGARDAVKAIIAGEMGATVVVDPRYGPITFDTIRKIESGESVPTEIIIPTVVIDTANAETMIEESF